MPRHDEQTNLVIESLENARCISVRLSPMINVTSPPASAAIAGSAAGCRGEDLDVIEKKRG